MQPTPRTSALARRATRRWNGAKAWWDRIEGSSRLRWEWIGVNRAEKARGVFFRQRDKDYSFTDCTSLVVMQELKLKRVLTTDRHFRQMGFEVVPDLGG